MEHDATIGILQARRWLLVVPEVRGRQSWLPVWVLWLPAGAGAGPAVCHMPHTMGHVPVALLQCPLASLHGCARQSVAGGARLGRTCDRCCSSSDRESRGDEDIIPGCKSLASPFSQRSGPLEVHLKPYLFIMRDTFFFFISLL